MIDPNKLVQLWIMITILIGVIYGRILWKVREDGTEGDSGTTGKDRKRTNDK